LGDAVQRAPAERAAAGAPATAGPPPTKALRTGRGYDYPATIDNAPPNRPGEGTPSRPGEQTSFPGEGREVGRRWLPRRDEYADNATQLVADTRRGGQPASATSTPPVQAPRSGRGFDYPATMDNAPLSRPVESTPPG